MSSAPRDASARPFRFSVIMPTYQRRDLVRQNVVALGATRRPWPCELIVVVDGSTDGTEQALRELPEPFPTTVLVQPNQGAAAARNAGARHARGEILLFLDDDMEADPELLVEHDAVIGAGADSVVGHLPLATEAPRNLMTIGIERWADRRRERLVDSDGTLELDDLLTGQLSVRAQVFAALGGFDGSFTAGGTFGGEDTDFLYRLRCSGADLRFAPDAISHQHYVVAPEQLLRQWRQGGRADALLLRKHAELGDSRDRVGLSAVLRSTAEVLPDSVTSAAGRYVAGRVRAGHVDGVTDRAFTGLRHVAYWKGRAEGADRMRRGLRALPGTAPLVRVLAYHAVEDVRDDVIGRWSVSPERFAAQLDALVDAGFGFLTPERFVAHLTEGAALPDRSVLLTFDDAYASVYDQAAPVLRGLGASALVFMVSSRIGSHNAWDTDRGGAQLPLLDGDQLRKLVDEGWEVGAHTRSHARLVGLDALGLRQELVTPRRDFVDAGLSFPRTVAYPYGEHSARVRAAAREAGYDVAFGLEETRRAPSLRSRHAVPRIEVTRDLGPEELLRRVLDPPLRPFAALEREARDAARTLIGAHGGAPR
ncbi:polysaccharide deacetylase family protein [Actinomycetospora sp. TBRC 11914]|uniref:polysaccharide deacetylase family protein n=1 Tax=Actinomycetospora sp. TBRC 11914 TaxID=2729387 RepID=UPI00145E566F|nr:polysaccharide deacetylase family protein [Actinomycetospora sp. TBRC 11914]NMO90356.1 polysaccharide deacetylase family protein [Actinomycetospora sp. TBRC 11914]